MNADIFLRAAELEYNEHEYTCLLLKKIIYWGEELHAYRAMFAHDKGWWNTPPARNRRLWDARLYALLLAWAMALEGDL